MAEGITMAASSLMASKIPPDCSKKAKNNGGIVRYFRIIECTKMGRCVAYQVPLPTCLKFFVILTNEKAKTTYQIFIKELSNPPKIDTVVILQHTRPNEGMDICIMVAFIHGWSKSMADICTSKNKTSLRGLSMALMYLWLE